MTFKHIVFAIAFGGLLTISGCATRGQPTLKAGCNISGSNQGIDSYRCDVRVGVPFETPEQGGVVGANQFWHFQ